MPESEDTQTEETEETIDELWARVNESDETEEVAEEVYAEAEKDDKMLRKLSSKVDDLDKKFREEKLQQEKARFLNDEGADDLEKDLFRGVEGMVRDPESLARAIELSKKLADKQRAKMADYEAQARSQVERSWGVANPGQAPQPTEDEAKKQAEAIAKGDTVVGLHALMDDDPLMQGRL